MKRAAQIVLVVVLVIAIVGTSSFFANSIWQSERQETYSNLQTYTRLSACAYAEKLSGIEQLLRAMAQEYAQLSENGYSAEDCVKMFSSIEGTNAFKRFGVSLPDGTSYTTDGKTGNLAAENGFDQALLGYFVITDSIVDTFDPTAETVHVFRYPVLRGDEVIAEIFATYTTSQFQSMLGFDKAPADGHSLALVSMDGSLICGSAGSEYDIEGVSLLEMIDSVGENSTAVSQIESDLLAGSEGSAEYAINGEDGRLLYHAPLEMSDSLAALQIVCSAPTAIIDAQMEGVMGDVYRMMAVVVVLVLAIVAALLSGVYFDSRRHRKELEQMVYVDPLTGGDTAVRFRERVEEADEAYVVVSLDIHSYKTIASICGKDLSRKIIQGMNDIIAGYMREDELFAREESDRFLLALRVGEGETTAVRLRPLSDDIGALAVTLQVPRLRVVAGSCMWKPGDDVEEACNNAVAAKRELSQKSDVSMLVLDYTQVDIELFERERTMEVEFAPALARGEFEAWYQPKYSPETGEIVGSEALVRWRQADGTLVPPYQFIPLFESNGMIKDLDEYMFRLVCSEQMERVRAGKKAVPVSINLSRASLFFGDVAARYKAIAAEVGVDLALVPIEITESAADEGADLRALADDLVNSGFVLIMDDFGAGYSSLASLSRTHFEGIKIDKSLVDNIGQSDGEKLIKHSMALAQDMGMIITAEGVEISEQVEFLRNLGCDNIQGYFYSRPLPREEYEKLL